MPELCIRYAQNGRSLFTFLTSSEPHSFQQFLRSTECPTDLLTSGKKKRQSSKQSFVLPTLKLDRVYDYFVEVVGMGMASGSNLQRWLEVQERIADAKHLDQDSLRVLKAIGTLNLFSTGGLVRASRSLVILAMCNDAANLDEQQHWQTVIDRLVEKNLLDELKTLDELRTWAGSDFDIETEITAHIAKEQLLPLSKILEIAHPLKPLIAQRHSYETGTLRCFEQRYLDRTHDLTKLACARFDADGLVGYWVDETPLSQAVSQIPAETIDGKPLILLVGTNLDVLRIRAVEQAALQTMLETVAQLQTDKVARRSAQQRLVQIGKLLQGTLNHAFEISSQQVTCWVCGDRRKLHHITAFNAMLSEICDEVYAIQVKGQRRSQFVLWNELINRRDLTSQGAKARRELITAMLERSDQERLGLMGNGPEVSMYASVLQNTGIHRREGEEGVLGFYRPSQPGVLVAWDAIDEFCKEAKAKRQSIDQLYKRLGAPPYGIKQGVIPVLLAAVLLRYSDEVGVYRDGTFLPMLSSEHFELLMKDPSRFAVRYFDLSGLRTQVFKELEQILKHPNAAIAPGLRNLTLLSVVRPLLIFVRKLPAYTLKTEALSDRAKVVLNAVQTVSEPDELLFTGLPQACGLTPIRAIESETLKSSPVDLARELRQRLTEVIQELRDAYKKLLEQCEGLIRQEFMPRGSQVSLRKHLEVWAGGLLGQCLEPTLRGFIAAAADDSVSDRDWLEGVIMVIVDKPPTVWTDEDRVRFQSKLSDLAHRFKKLLAIQTEVMSRTVAEFEAWQVSIAAQDGQQVVQTVVLIESGQRAQVENLQAQMRSVLNTCDDPQLQQGALTLTVKEYMGEATHDELEAERVAKLNSAEVRQQGQRNRLLGKSRQMWGECSVVKPIADLIEFLTQKMSLAAIYQPVIILHLLARGGTASRAELALTLSGYDGSDLKEWDRILMDNPRRWLVGKHQILTYNKDSQLFHLNVELDDQQVIASAKAICEQKIAEWIQKQIDKGEAPEAEILRFYRVLEAARHQQGNDLLESTLEVEDFAMRMAVSEVYRLFPEQSITQQPYSTLGFDILVGTATDPVVYVKVKGTPAIAPSFVISEAERAFSVEKASQYVLLVIYGIDLTSEEYKVAIHRGAVTAQTVALAPIQWKCSLKRV